MAYVREEKETVEMDFPLETVWEAIKKAVTRLEWTIETNDETTHRIRTRTKKAFLTYATLLSIEAKAVSEKITRVVVNAETPVTTLTSVIDFGKSQERITVFLRALSIELKPEKDDPTQKG